MSRSTRAAPSPADFGFRGRFHEEPAARAAFADASGILAVVPRAVAVPRDADDVAALLRWATATGTPVVPRGAGTGMPGGNVGPGVVVDLQTHFAAPPRLDAATHTVHAQPGLTREALNRAIESSGLHFPVDPSSGDRCTLGGMAANNSSGAHSVRYGSTRRWVRALEVVLADGTPATLRRGAPPAAALQASASAIDSIVAPVAPVIRERWPNVRKNSSGYALDEYLESGDLIDLIIGSEGTLAIVTGLTLDLAPIPATSGLVLLEFASLDRAIEAVLRLLPLQPESCEILDRTFLDLVRRGGGGFGLGDALEAVLLVEVAAGSPHGAERRVDEVHDVLGDLPVSSRSATDPRAVAELWSIRHAASPIIAREAGTRVSMQFIEDSVVPVERLSEYIRRLRATLDRHGVPAVIFGHAGDGNLHVNPLIDVTAPGWQAVLEAVLDEVADAVIELGGTLSGEHGDGRLRAPLLRRVWGDALVGAFQRVKTTFDPLGILNPGVILPLEGQQPFEHLRIYS